MSNSVGDGLTFVGVHIPIFCCIRVQNKFLIFIQLLTSKVAFEIYFLDAS